GIGLIGNPGTRIDPVLGSTTKFVLVKTIYNIGTHQLDPDRAGENDFGWQMNTGEDPVWHAARLIQVQDWNDLSVQDRNNATDIMVHEVGHSWNKTDYFEGSNTTTAFVRYHEQYMRQFMALSGGWLSTTSKGPDGVDVITWTFGVPGD